MNQKRKQWSPKHIPTEVVIPSFGLPEEEMKLKEAITRNKTLNLASRYLEYSKDHLYHYLGDDEDARRSIRKWFPIDDFLSSIDEGKVLASSDTIKLIKLIDDIIFQIVDGSERSKKIEGEVK